MGENTSQFLILLWKNWLIQKRKSVATVFEILLPVVFAVLLLAVRQIVEVTDITEPITWESFSIDQFRDDLIPPAGLNGSGMNMWRVAYSPLTPQSKMLMENMAKQINVTVDGKCTDRFFFL